MRRCERKIHAAVRGAQNFAAPSNSLNVFLLALWGSTLTLITIGQLGHKGADGELAVAQYIRAPRGGGSQMRFLPLSLPGATQPLLKLLQTPVRPSSPACPFILRLPIIPVLLSFSVPVILSSSLVITIIRFRSLPSLLKPRSPTWVTILPDFLLSAIYS